MLDQIIYSVRLFQPEAALAVTFLVLILIDLFSDRSTGKLSALVALAGLFVTAWLLSRESSLPPNSIFSQMYAVDGFSMFFKVVILLASFLVVLFSLNSRELVSGIRHLGEYYALLMSLTLGMVLMTGASNLLMMYLSLELTSLSSYILAGFTKQARDSSEASLKYVLYGAVSSGLMLYGISIVYGLTGALDIYGINHALATGDISIVPLVVAGILIVAGFGYKISAVPFHFWTPDVYEGAPITITAFLSVASKAAGFAMMIRFFKVSFIDPAVGNLAPGAWAIFRGFQWNELLAMISVLTMTLGNLVAIWQNNLKRLLAYSSIAHAGYMLMGIVVLSNEGITAVMIYFLVYLFMNLGAFYLVMLVANQTGSEDLEAYKGLGYRSPLAAVIFTIFLLSLTGIPPTAGFIGKLYLFASLINAKWFWLAIVGVLNSVVSLYYYARILKQMFLSGPPADLTPVRFSTPQIVLLLALAIPTILLGLYFGPLVNFAQASVSIFGIR
ncbi:MAG TPA: NADH-quinone oxidoreductase subunit N [Bacteroidota bacterium]|nr:NADH-quinone oxidoreductase subunit N [Bacteroidota bacterium]